MVTRQVSSIWGKIGSKCLRGKLIDNPTLLADLCSHPKTPVNSSTGQWLPVSLCPSSSAQDPVSLGTGSECPRKNPQPVRNRSGHPALWQSSKDHSSKLSYQKVLSRSGPSYHSGYLLTNVVTGIPAIPVSLP